MNPPLYARARHTIQCTHPETAKTGNWLFSGDNHRTPGTTLSPVFTDMMQLTRWMKQAGWSCKVPPQLSAGTKHTTAFDVFRVADTTVTDQFPEGIAVVIGGHTLGLRRGVAVEVMRALYRLGATQDQQWGTVPLPLSFADIRLATEADFDFFRVNWHPDYTTDRATAVPAGGV